MRHLLSAAVPVNAIGGFNITATEGQPSAAQTVAAFTDPEGTKPVSSYTANINWGDGTSGPGTVVPGVDLGGEVDILFLADITGSMGGVITTLQNAFTDVTTTVAAASAGSVIPMDFHYGLADYQDYSDGHPYDTAGINIDQPFTGDATAVQTAINSLSLGGGGDWPEENLKALDAAANNWALDDGSSLAFGGRAGAQKIIIWCGDAPGHYLGETDSIFGSPPSDFYPSVDGTITDLKAAGVNVVGLDILPQNEGIDQSADPTYPGGPSWGSPNQEEAICSATDGLALYNIGYSADLTTFVTEVVGAIMNELRTANIVQASHTYAEEGSYVVTTTVTDADGTSAPATSFATVADAPLTGSSTATAGGSPYQGGSSVLSGATFADANPGDHSADMSAVINWGDGTTSPGTVTYNNNNGVYTVSGPHHTYPAVSVYLINITVSDVGGQTGIIQGTAVTGPLLTITTNNQWMLAGQTPPSLASAYTVSYYPSQLSGFGLDTLPTVATTATSSSPAGSYPIVASGAAASHYVIVYHNTGVLTVEPTINADYLMPDPLNPAQNILYVWGTAGNDSILINSAGSSNSVLVIVNGVSRGTFGSTSQPISRIVVHGDGGTDSIVVSPSVTAPAWLYLDNGTGGIIRGGGGPTYEFGDPGAILYGGIGRSILIGGRGAQTLNAGNAGAGDAILIGGTTAYNPATPIDTSHDAALVAILNEWASSDGYSARVTDITSTGVDDAAGQTDYLKRGTVYNDFAADRLYGSATAMDLFFRSIGDTVGGQKSGETTILV